MVRTLLYVLAACAVVFPVACGNSADEKAVEEAIEAQSGEKVEADVSNGKIVIKGKDGETRISELGGVEIPDGFPKDIPIYKGASVVMSHKQGSNFVLNLSSRDDIKKVAEGYKQAMSAEGWEEDSTMDMGAQAMLMYKKGNRQVSIVIMTADEKTQITLSVEEEN